MTRQLQHKTVCPECKHEFDTTTPFSQWLRNLPAPLDSSRISNQNLDYIWHCYGENWFILIEEKRNGASQSFAQKDTHSLIVQLLRISSGCAVTNERSKKNPLYFRGYYLVSFEKTTPDDSAWVNINGMQYNNPKEIATRLLTTGTVADTALLNEQERSPDDITVLGLIQRFSFERLRRLMGLIMERMAELHANALEAGTTRDKAA